MLQCLSKLWSLNLNRICDSDAFLSHYISDDQILFNTVDAKERPA